MCVFVCVGVHKKRVSLGLHAQYMSKGVKVALISLNGLKESVHKGSQN